MSYYPLTENPDLSESSVWSRYYVLKIFFIFSFSWQDFGYVQTTSTEILKSYIFNEPIMVDAGRLPPLGPAAMFMVFYANLEVLFFKGPDRILVFFIFIWFITVPSFMLLTLLNAARNQKNARDSNY